MKSVAVWLVIACVALTAAIAPAMQAPRGPFTALVGGRVLATPDAAVIDDGVVLFDGPTITAVGRRSDVPIPEGARVIDCTGATVVAGFWNSHVHFIGWQWSNAERADADHLTVSFWLMLTKWGFTTVIDLSSNLANTVALGQRITRGEVDGSAIYTAGTGFVPGGGSPYYIRPLRLPELTSPQDAEAKIGDAVFKVRGAIKLFTGSWAERDRIVVMPLDVVRAATARAHLHGLVVFAHPSNSAGARVAIEGGVDVLAHTFPAELDGRPWDRSLPAMMKARGMALIPTLKLLPYELGKAKLPQPMIDRVLERGIEQLRAFSALDGDVMFGTDVGYMDDYDPTDEYVHMQHAGLSYRQILRSLTTAPATRMKATMTGNGRLERGAVADIVILDGDPERDVRAFANVRSTIRAGKIIWQKQPRS